MKQDSSKKEHAKNARCKKCNNRTVRIHILESFTLRFRMAVKLLVWGVVEFDEYNFLDVLIKELLKNEEFDKEAVKAWKRH